MTMMHRLAAFAAIALSATATIHAQEKNLLVLTHAGLYKHESLPHAEKALEAWGPENGFRVTSLRGHEQDRESIDISVITAQYLEQFDAVLFMTNGNLPFADSQREALLNFVRRGKGLIGVHCATLTWYDWPAFGAMLGGYFQRPIAQRRLFVLAVEDMQHPATRMLGSSWPIADEFYLYGRGVWNASKPEEHVDALFDNRIPVALSRERIHVLLRIDTAKSDLKGLEDRLNADDDLPQAWWRDEGQGRVFYTALGHRPEIWTSNAAFKEHLVGGIRWALKLDNAASEINSETR